jgi:hypothetical protein
MTTYKLYREVNFGRYRRPVLLDWDLETGEIPMRGDRITVEDDELVIRYRVFDSYGNISLVLGSETAGTIVPAARTETNVGTVEQGATVTGLKIDRLG